MPELFPFTEGPPLKIHADATWSNGELRLSFVVEGDVSSVSVPVGGAPTRRDELWKSTCFEAFLQPLDASSYFEFNLSPPGDWNVYAFDRYREGMRREARVHSVQVARLQKSLKQLALTASVDLTALALSSGFRLGLCAVIENQQGETSYWALKHPASRPDFHDQKGFQLEFSASSIRN